MNIGTPVDHDEAQLASATVKLKLEFASLLTKVRLSLQNLQISAKSVLSHLKCVEAIGVVVEPVRTSQSETFSATLSKPLEHSLEDLFPAIAPYCSWFNHLIVENIIETFCGSDDSIQQKWREFKGRFNVYCESRLCKCPQNHFGEDHVKSESTFIVMKLDYEWSKIKVKQLEIIRDTVAESLKINPCNLYLRAVQNGCVELLFQLPVCIAERFIPPSLEQMIILKKLGIFQLRCDPKLLHNQSGTNICLFTEKTFTNVIDIAQYLKVMDPQVYTEYMHIIDLDVYRRATCIGPHLKQLGDKNQNRLNYALVLKMLRRSLIIIQPLIIITFYLFDDIPFYHFIKRNVTGVFAIPEYLQPDTYTSTKKTMYGIYVFPEFIH